MAPQITPHNLFVRLLFALASGISFLIYFFTFRVFRYRFDVIIDNLSKSFPEKSQHEIDVYARDYYRHMGDLIVEPLLFILVDNATREKLAIYTNIGILGRFFECGKNVVTLSSHCGNWEYLINLPKIQDLKTYTAYTPLSNKFINHYILKLRSLYGIILIPKKYFFRGALSALKKKDDPSMVLVIADQRPAPGSIKNSVNFLDQSTNVQVGAERLAEASGVAVLYLACLKKERFHYEYTFHVVTEDAEKCEPMEVTKSYYRLLQDNILLAPSNWLWSHKRWKQMQEAQVVAASTL